MVAGPATGVRSTPMPKSPAANDLDGWVRQLASDSRRRDAKQHLLQAGSRALPAIRRGLSHPKPAVRRACTSLLDQLVDDAAIPDLVAALDDDDPDVCRRALHALACDRCKQNECRPGEELFVPKALEFVRDHPNPDVRAGAIDALARVASRRPDVAEALLVAAARDPHPGVRNMAHLRTRKLRASQLG